MEANNDGSNKKPATKCDRRSPCSSCIAAALDCRISRRVPERRQRVLISARYDEAMENVNRSLQEVSEGLQKLLRNSEQTKGFPNSSPALFTANYVSNASGPSEGYRGDSSFKAHVQRVTEALRDATANVDSSLTDQSFATAMTATQLIKEVADSEETTSSEENVNSPSFKVQYPELEGRPLPPLEPVLKLLRLIHTEKQRFFIDTPVIDEAEFAELCQKVYFAINDYSLSTWTTVNTGLYYLFLGLEEHERSQVGITLADIQAYTRLLSVNIEAGIHSFRLCHEPSMEGCQALALLTAFCMKSGRSALAWSLIAAASRMCIDLGWHRLSKHPKGPELSKKRRIFWWVYVIDKGMAFTLGRTPSIHQYDVATERTSFPLDIPGPPGYLYGGFVEFAVIVGDMHIQLFSASAQRTSPQVRVENAKAFASRLFQVNNSLKQTLRDEPPADARFQDASVLFDIIMHCLVTIVYRIVPCGEPKPHPLQCHTGCIEAARQALSTIVQASQTLGQRNPLGWNMFLNLLFSLVPFTCFVVLAGNTIACLSPEDLALLSATVRAIEPMATSSPSGKKLFDVCRSFYQVASFSVTRQAAISAAPASAPVAVTQVFGNPPVGSFSEPLDSSAAPLYEHIMAPQDWDTVMGEFDLGIGAGAMASFVEPYIPFDGRVL
ncbi:fungal specific transcription factor domain-containing protein [Aspergillus affinis]|uniref:fungal specific transcription factor domain-containing protein n=1 Tax=Aspergillus affinis TaxID=1070780 RepID=UPI0022FEF964|nr:uncharacterized protein KD926_000973 [Aspergillus affinis]KAI9044372.1 hypothetical protein KD926_000973 [Aspergillus affinis]